MTITSETVKRWKIQEIWRKIYDKPMSAALMADEKEWQFFIALLDEKPMEVK